MFKPTEVHRQRLIEEGAKLRLPGDIEDTLRAFHQMEPRFTDIGHPAIDRMFHQLRGLARLLDHHAQLSEEEIRLAGGALHYFMCDDDMVSDEFGGSAGLVDDALIVIAACEKLEGAFLRLHI